MRRYCSIVGLAAVLAWGVVGVAGAGDNKDEPAYVILDGRLIPTRIVPPKPQAQRGNPAATVAGAQAAARGRAAAGVGNDPQAAPQEAAAGANAAAPADVDLDARYPRFPGLRGPYRPYEYMPYPFYYSTYGYYTYRQSLDTYDAAREVERRDAQQQFNERDMERRKERVLRSHDEAVRVGLDELKAGAYQKAVIALTLAAELDQSDPACRIHLAQARMALGHYAEAGKALRRALELQPKLVYVPLELGQYYGQESALDEHVDAVAKAAGQGDQPADVHFLLGFMEFQRGRYAPAYNAFRAASRGNAKDSLTAAYLKITKPATKARSR
jgi:tetratricopeptide (TPR) repeat protein